MKIFLFYLRLLYVKKLDGISKLIGTFEFDVWKYKQGRMLAKKVENFVEQNKLNVDDYLDLLNSLPVTYHRNQYPVFKTDLEMYISHCLTEALYLELSGFKNSVVSEGRMRYVFERSNGYLLGSKIIELGIDQMIHLDGAKPVDINAVRFYGGSPMEILELFGVEQSRFKN